MGKPWRKLFPVTTNPRGATGDGMALAWRAGAVLRDLEFVQFHPTALPEGSLVSEACRGEGALLLNRRGERFMPRYDPLGELAPRDVGARAVFREGRETGGVYLDLRPIPHLEERFPTVVARARALGLDPLREPLPVAHYAVGGVKVDPRGYIGVPGLYAAGEVASTGFHGANRLASNSLLEGLVMGERAAKAALGDLAFPPRAEPLPALAAPPEVHGGLGGGRSSGPSSAWPAEPSWRREASSSWRDSWPGRKAAGPTSARISPGLGRRLTPSRPKASSSAGSPGARARPRGRGGASAPSPLWRRSPPPVPGLPP